MVTARSHVKTQTTWVALMDLLSLLIGSFVGVALRFGHDDVTQYVFGHLEGWLLLFGGILLANYLSGSYRLQYMFSRFNLVVTWLFSLVFTIVLLSLTSYAWFTVVLGRGVLLMAVACYSVLSLTLKLLVYRHLFRSDLFLVRAAIVGTGSRARELRAMLEGELVIPAHKIVTFVRVVDRESSDTPSETLLDGVAVVESHADELEAVIRSLGVKLVVVGLDDRSSGSQLYPQLSRLRFQGIELMSPLTASEVYSGRTPLEMVNEDTMMQLSMDCEFPLVSRTKRVIDIVASLVASILCVPLAALVALVIKMSDPREPVIYSQTRVGQFGVLFRMFKFRTMRSDAEKQTGAVWSADDDPRVTKVGNVLRKSRLDEIPQFWNVLLGDMSLVGPRPERPELGERLDQDIPFFRERENVMPGLTGWAQIRYPYGSSVEDARRKLEYDLYYVKHLSLSLDLQIILSTLRIMVFGKERTM